MLGKLLARAHRCKTIRDSGLFSSFPGLEDSLLISVERKVYILYDRTPRTYYFILLKPETGYDILSILHEERRLELSDLVSIADNLLPKENLHAQ
jgi:hypothetical protein